MVHGTNPGRRPFLTQEEEKCLTDHLVHIAQLGYGKTRGQVLNMVEIVAREKGIMPQDHRRFMERNPNCHFGVETQRLMFEWIVLTLLH